MTCRAPTSSTTCTGSSPTGAGLSYDNEGQLTHWTSALNGTPTPSRDTYTYDGEGARVAQQATSPTGITTTTDYLLGGLEEQQSVGGSVRPSTTLTEYYPLPGIGTAVRVTTSTTSTLSYLAGDQLGSVSVALSTSGTVTAQALYSPYGTVRYSSGTMPTAHGFTGQIGDSVTGLDYYGARYYDPTLGQFSSADSVLAGGLNRYAYVGGNPTTATDPSGHAQCYECVGAAAGGDWFNSGGVGPGTTVLYDLAEYTLGLVSMYHDVQTILNPHADLATKLGAFGDVLVQGGLDVLMLTGEGEELRGAELSGRTADELTRAAVKASEWTDDAAKAGLVADDGLNVPGRVAEEDAAKAAAAAGDDGSHLHGGSGTPGDEGPGHGAGEPGDEGPGHGGSLTCPDSMCIARGGQSPVPPPGEVFSGAQGQTVEEAGQGVPHGQFRWTTAGDIRAGGGTVEPAPEMNPGVGRINYQHVDVCLGEGGCQWSDLVPNVPKNLRFGGKDYPFYDGYLEWGP